ncbi:hypothetical protein M405DRAFT_847592 [Rhizopogon salebrosus TDB-379]|nr:hypothetical protein M405DRAFT_847592 [Rhizopogon salebrosus TDB-379]
MRHFSGHLQLHKFKQLSTHRLKDHYNDALVQTLDHDQKSLYFPVRGGDAEVSHNLRKKTGASILARELQRLAPAAGNSAQEMVKKAVLPFFEQVGAVDHVAPYEASALCDLVVLPAKGDNQLKKLQKAVVLCIAQGAYTVLPFWPQLAMPAAPSGGSYYHISINSAQLTALAALWKKLAQRQDYGDLTDAINSVLEQLYMPSNTLDMVRDRHISPVAAFICLCAVHPEGGFILPEHITYTTVCTQFDIRLFILDFLERKWNWADAITRYYESIIGDWATEMKNTPFGFAFLFDIILLPESSLELPSINNQDETTMGYGLYSLSLDPDDLGDSGVAPSILLDSLSEIGTLSWEYIYVLMHLLALPACGTEEEMWQYTNLNGNYNKTSSMIGIYKTIIRVVPYKVVQMITILLRMRLHCQFAQALRRKFLSYKNINPLAKAANLAMGHTKKTGEMHYSREAGDLVVPLSLQEKFEVVSRHTIWTADGMWHWYKIIVQQDTIQLVGIGLWHTIWVADGMWHWYKMIVQQDSIQLDSIQLVSIGLYDSIICMADGMWHWYKMIVQQDTIQLVGIGLYDSVIHCVERVQCG